MNNKRFLFFFRDALFTPYTFGHKHRIALRALKTPHGSKQTPNPLGRSGGGPLQRLGPVQVPQGAELRLRLYARPARPHAKAEDRGHFEVGLMQKQKVVGTSK